MYKRQPTDRLKWELERNALELGDKRVRYSNLKEDLEELDGISDEERILNAQAEARQLAIDKIQELSGEMQKKLRGKLNDRVSEIMEFITEGKYTRLNVEELSLIHIFRVRSLTAYALHKFFQERGFVYVHTPIITGSDCEGAGEMFRVTTMDMENVPKTEDGAVDYTQDFFGKETSLTVSGQLNAETYAQAFGNVYTFGPTFRAENSNTTRHADVYKRQVQILSVLHRYLTRSIRSGIHEIHFQCHWIHLLLHHCLRNL